MPGAPLIDPAKAALALNLADAGYGGSQIAAEIGVSRPSVHGILHKHGRWGDVCNGPVFEDLRREQNKTLEIAYRAAAVESLELAHTPDKLAKASYFQLVLGSATEIDKARLLAGESTSNVAVAHHIEAEDLAAAAQVIAQSLLRFSADSNAVSSPQNREIDVTPEPNNIRPAKESKE